MKASAPLQRPREDLVVVVVVVVRTPTPNYLRQASQNLGKYYVLTLLIEGVFIGLISCQHGRVNASAGHTAVAVQCSLSSVLSPAQPQHLAATQQQNLSPALLRADLAAAGMGGDGRPILGPY